QLPRGESRDPAAGQHRAARPQQAPGEREEQRERRRGERHRDHVERQGARPERTLECGKVELARPRAPVAVGERARRQDGAERGVADLVEQDVVVAEERPGESTGIEDEQRSKRGEERPGRGPQAPARRATEREGPRRPSAAPAGAHAIAWGHVVMFTPWRMNWGPSSLAHLERAGWTRPAPEAFPSGLELAERYLEPLAQLPELRSRVHTHAQVVFVGRSGVLKGDMIGKAERGERPFRLLVRDASGRENFLQAFAAIDASGVYGNPNWAGDGGI